MYCLPSRIQDIAAQHEVLRAETRQHCALCSIRNFSRFRGLLLPLLRLGFNLLAGSGVRSQVSHGVPIFYTGYDDIAYLARLSPDIVVAYISGGNVVSRTYLLPHVINWHSVPSS